MGETKQINIKNRSCCLYTNLIDLKNVDAEYLKIDKKSYKNIDIYYIRYSPFIKIGDYWSYFIINPLYLDITHASGYVECNSVECNSNEEKNGNKYLVLDDIYENKEVLEKYEEVWEGIEKN